MAPLWWACVDLYSPRGLKLNNSTNVTGASRAAAPSRMSLHGSTVSVGSTVTFMARIHAAGSVSPNGSITISERKTGNICCQGMISKDPNSNDGLATITNSNIPAGSHTLVAVYGGDNAATYYQGAQSNTVSLTVVIGEVGDVNGD